MRKAQLSTDLKLKIIDEKLKQLPDILKEFQIDCWIIFVRETSVNPDPIMDLLIGGNVVWSSVFIYYFDAKKNFRKEAIVGNFDVDAEVSKGIWNNVIGYKEGIKFILKNYIDQINPKNIALNFSEDDVISDGLSHGMFLKISKILVDKIDRFISAKPIIQALRGRKTTTEINLIREACELTEVINRRISLFIKPDMTEILIQQRFHSEMENEEVGYAWEKAQDPTVDAGPEKSFGHIGPTDLKTKIGHTLHNDFGIKLNGYCSDLQRMWYFGNESIPDQITHAFETVKMAIRLAAQYIKPGVTGQSVDEIARNYVISRGYEEYDHALGHQVGRAAHDGGVLLGPLWEKYIGSVEGLIEENNIFTLELHVKTKHYGTVSLEEMIRITGDGCVFLVPPQDNLIIIKV